MMKPGTDQRRENSAKRKPSYKMRFRLATTNDKNKMLKALRVHPFAFADDPDAGTIVVTNPRNQKEIFRGIAKDSETWLVSYPDDLFKVRGGIG